MIYQPVGITAGASSFDIAPAPTLDPELFDGDRMDPKTRLELLGVISGFLASRYGGNEQWLRVWAAGSGVSYRWYAANGLKDLDILLGIDFIAFRRANQSFIQVGNDEIASHLNDEMRIGLWPSTRGWRGQYEVTWYVNPGSWDIRAISPYAAYDLIEDTWTVRPSKTSPRIPQEWENHVAAHRDRAFTAVQRYSQTLAELQGATNPAHRRDAEARFQHAVDAAVSLYDSVHNGRKLAFSPVGGGFGDINNFLWQAGKKEGWIPALREIKDYQKSSIAEAQRSTYGLELPDTDTLVRRALLGRR